MNRMHIHLSVEDIEKSVAFYSGLFGTEPTVHKPDYAKWMLDDPRVNFAMSSHQNMKRGIEHIGIQSETADEFAKIFGRLEDAGGAILDEGATTCCYAQSEKHWTMDPDGVAWESFLTNGDATEYGTRLDPSQYDREQKPDKLASCCG